MAKLFLVFMVTTLTELWVIIEVGSVLGPLTTIALVVLTAFLGATLLRQQGLSTLFRARERLASGTIPAEEMVEGLLLAFGGALLLTPGFITDAIGLSCLIPYSRRWIARNVISRFRFMPGPGMSDSGQAFRGFYHNQGPNQSHGDYIEGEFSEDKESDRGRH